MNRLPKPLREPDGDLDQVVLAAQRAISSGTTIKSNQLVQAFMAAERATPDGTTIQVNDVSQAAHRCYGCRAPAGNLVALDLALDRDGILHVAAREKNTCLERRISIEQAVPRLSAAELEEARGRIDALFGDDAAADDADSPSVGDAALAACWNGQAPSSTRPI